VTDSARWQQVASVFDAALARPAHEQLPYLDEACRGDDALRGEVDSLLAAHRRAGSFLQSGLVASDVRERLPLTPSLGPGDRLGRFEVVAPVGSGGMGVVYHARDTRLHRDVAIKLLDGAPGLSDHANETLEREARAISRLVHPHICTLFDVCSAPLPGGNEVRFLVMELVNGERLDLRLARGTLPHDHVITYAGQIGEALAFAHRMGIVHRDLKPQNILLTDTGVKLLDFGLALVMEGDAASPGTPSTRREVVGTARYMAPEQIRGEAIDGRADLFSLGVVLHQMLSGVCAFDRPTLGETLRAILHEPPAPLPASMPPMIADVVHRCLEKDPRDRFQTAEEFTAALGPARLPQPQSDRRHPADDGSLRRRAVSSWRWRLPMAAAVILLAVAASRMAGEPPRLRVESYVQLTSDGQQKTALVTDGTHLFMAEPLNNTSALMRLPVTGGTPTPVALPFAKPGLDDVSVATSELFVANTSDRYPFSYWAVSVSDGRLSRLPVRAHDVHPSYDGKWIAYAVDADVFVSRRDRQAPRKVASFPGKPPGNIAWSPNGRSLRLTSWDWSAGESSIWEVPVDGGAPRPLLTAAGGRRNECCGRWTADGAHYIFESRQGHSTNLWALSEPTWTRRRATPFKLTSGPLQFRSVAPSTDGRSLYAIGEFARGEIMKRDGRSGEWVPLAFGTTVRSMASVTYSPDRGHVAYVTFPERTLWVSRIDDQDRRQVTFEPFEAGEPRWAPDGRRLAFQGRVPGGPWKVYIADVDGGPPGQLVEGDLSEAAPDWSPDGKRVVFGGTPFLTPGTRGVTSLHVMDLQTRRVSQVPASETLWASRWSPDGRFLVTLSFDFRKLMLFDFERQRWEPLAEGVVHFANWSSDGEYIYFERWEPEAVVARIRIRDRREEHVGRLQQFRRTIGPDRCWSGLAPDNSLLVLRDVGAQEVYALNLVRR